MIRQLFSSLSTGAKLFLILSAAVLPLALPLAWTVGSAVVQAQRAQVQRVDAGARLAARSIETLIARNSLGLRIAAGAALDGNERDPCSYANRALSEAPGVIHRFVLRDREGNLLCLVNGFTPRR